ncbi:unnamed protein product [Heterobilharzia americana]|nr:unnamed protein product [Heterobilharzia americana]
MSLPIVIYTDIVLAFQLSVCWYANHGEVLILYQSLFSNTCLVQFSFVMLLDVFFLVKMIKWSRSRNQAAGLHSSEIRNISPTITLLLLHTLSLIFALPCSISLFITNTIDGNNVDIPVKLIRFLLLSVNIGWILIFLQSSLNIILYSVRIKRFRQVLLGGLKCCRINITGVSEIPTPNSVTNSVQKKT